MICLKLGTSGRMVGVSDEVDVGKGDGVNVDDGWKVADELIVSVDVAGGFGVEAHEDKPATKKHAIKIKKMFRKPVTC